MRFKKKKVWITVFGLSKMQNWSSYIRHIESDGNKGSMSNRKIDSDIMYGSLKSIAFLNYFYLLGLKKIAMQSLLLSSEFPIQKLGHVDLVIFLRYFYRK